MFFLSGLCALFHLKTVRASPTAEPASVRMGPAEIHDSMLRDGLDDAFSGKHSGWHTEDLVMKAQLTREARTGRRCAADAWAAAIQDSSFADSTGGARAL